jgi:hypothetical protein
MCAYLEDFLALRSNGATQASRPGKAAFKE